MPQQDSLPIEKKTKLRVRGFPDYTGIRLPPELFRFILVGISNTLICLITIFVLKSAFGAGDVTANLLGYALGLSNSFLLNRSFTFKFKSSAAGAGLRFALVASVGYGLNLGTLLVLINCFNFNSYLSQALGMLVYTGMTYFGCKYFAFSEPS